MTLLKHVWNESVQHGKAFPNLSTCSITDEKPTLLMHLN
jgi:hypothetical protein